MKTEPLIKTIVDLKLINHQKLLTFSMMINSITFLQRALDLHEGTRLRKSSQMNKDDWRMTIDEWKWKIISRREREKTGKTVISCISFPLAGHFFFAISNLLFSTWNKFHYYITGFYTYAFIFWIRREENVKCDVFDVMPAASSFLITTTQTNGVVDDEFSQKKPFSQLQK